MESFGFLTSYSVFAPKDKVDDGVVPIDEEQFNFHGMSNAHMQMFILQYISILYDAVEDKFANVCKVWEETVKEVGQGNTEPLYQQRYIIAETKKKPWKLQENLGINQ